jgi:hypothetical protein
MAAGAGHVAGAESAAGESRASRLGGWRAFFAIFAGVTTACFASYLAAVLAFDALDAPGLRHATVISLLIGLALSTRILAPTWLSQDLADLVALLPERSSIADSTAAYEYAPALRRVVAVIGGPLGVLIVFASSGFDGVLAVWDASTVWALVANAALFAMMAQVAWSQRVEERFLDREVTSRLRVPLLDREGLSPYARRGLRGSFFWLLGSSIASVLIFNWGFSWATLIVVLCTLGIGTFSLIDPSRRLRRRIQQAKRAELARVRGAIEAARAGALEASDAHAAGRLPGLLAWEARIAGVHEWPFDVSTWLRFGVLALVAVGSWLGGALVERILGLALD